MKEWNKWLHNFWGWHNSLNYIKLSLKTLKESQEPCWPPYLTHIEFTCRTIKFIWDTGSRGILPPPCPIPLYTEFQVNVYIDVKTLRYILIPTGSERQVVTCHCGCTLQSGGGWRTNTAAPIPPNAVERLQLWKGTTIHLLGHGRSCSVSYIWRNWILLFT